MSIKRTQRQVTACFFVVAIVVSMPLAGRAAPAAPEGNSAEGQRLHAAKCVACHDSKVYTRAERRVRSLDALRQQIDACGHMAKIELSEADQKNLVKYLNEQFYRF